MVPDGMRIRPSVPGLLRSLLCAAAVLVAGCGGSKGGSSTTTSNAAASSTAPPSGQTQTSASTGALAAPQFIAQADAICAQLNVELDKDHITTQRDIVRVVPHRVALEQAAVTELSKLTPPSSLASDYRQMIAIRQVLIKDISKLGVDAAAKDKLAQRSIYASSFILVRRMAAMAERDGFKSCGQLG